MKKLFIILGVAFSLMSFSPCGDVGVEYGLASFYHSKFNGRKTSSGEIFSNLDYTAAHKSLPLGVWVKVTNLKNDSSVMVKVNDRLPKHSKRSIDLSRKAAEQLDFIKSGLAKVRIEIVDPIKG